MLQAADRRQLGATSTPPSLPAPGWRRDLFKIPIERAPWGAFCIDGAVMTEPQSRPPDRPALVMVLAPILGLAIWVGLIALLF